MNPRWPGPLNRTLLTVIGLICLAAGGAGLAQGLGVFGPGRAQIPVLADSTLDRLQLLWWPRYAAIAVAVIIGALVLFWLAAQRPRRRSTATLHCEADPTDGMTSMDADTLADAVEADIATHGGAESARADITGSVARPHLAARITPTLDADLHALREYLARRAAADVATALETDPPETRVLFHMPRRQHTAARVH